ncbi:o-succinylbenzoate--CoA ligase [Cytobacillus spongiae]|uniref:o-succinylbenzoate--CoA ligase n=1 Tax=Cytobacillus spongiae TaxID=2901381 RepID=UPI001F3C1ED3|nr:o-succinylbenzoate--CoA ligase [Cytobacillus spongiae]UII54191.1 o-succinylbenzoate--CoA ligase [Cytobacillus spongiae]
MNIGTWISKNAHRFGDKTALVYRDVRLTYSQLNDRVNRLSHALLHLGVRKGDRVNGLLLNTNELLESLFACAKIGALFVPMNTRLSAEEIEYIVTDASASVFIYDYRLAPVVSQLKDRLPAINAWIEAGATSSENLVYEQLLSLSSMEEASIDVKEDDLHMLMYTSGTTGKPKGAMLSHGNTLWNAVNCINFIPFHAEDTTLTVAPLFHIGGMNVFTTPTFYLGGTVVVADKFDPKEVLELIEKEKISTLFLVPAMWLALMQYPDFHQYDLTSLKVCISGGAPCPLTVIEFFQQRNVPFFEGFGLTETAPFVCLLDKGETIRKKGSVGKPPIHTEVKVVAPNDQEVPTGEVGELVVKGPNIFAGYWNKPVQTKEAIKAGWFYTGDLARMDEEGFIYIVDRKKDMIISGGENIYPIEVEQVLFRMPGVKEVAVVGVPDEKWGETVKAYMVIEENKRLTLEEVQKFCDGKLARFKMPRIIETIEALPRNATGKVLKTALRN